MARSSSPRPYDNDCLRLPATSSPRKRGAKKKESTGLRLNRLCPPYVTPSSISSFGRRPSSAHIAESKSLKNSGEHTFCQSSASCPSQLARLMVAAGLGVPMGLFKRKEKWDRTFRLRSQQGTGRGLLTSLFW